MDIQTISVKELRTNFPKIKSQIDAGASFVLIHRSKPIATLAPYKKTPIKKSWSIDTVAGGFQIQKHIKQKLTPEFMEKLSEKRYE